MSLPVMTPPMTIQGDVVAVHSRWTRDGSRIVTDATVRTADGDVVVSQLGGSVDGIGMITMPGPELLVLGMTVAVAAHRDVDLEQHEHIMLDSAKVLAYPSSFVRTGPNKAGKSLFWESGCVFVTVDADGTSAIPGDDEIPIIDASIAEWNDKTAACSYLTVMNAGRKALEVGNDKVNLIKFRETTCICPPDNHKAWCRPAVQDDPLHCYSPQAAGITTAIYVDQASSSRDGAILDADIEINGVDFAVSVNGQSLGKGSPAELQNTLTHELGHLHGLEHPCRVSGDPQRVDNLGQPVPLCGATQDPRILESTMYNFQDAGETKKESLSDDDIAAICTIYPISQDPQTCEPVKPSSAGCCSASDHPDVSLLLAGSTVLILLRRRKSSPNP
jgi:hypothetical protein